MLKALDIPTYTPSPAASVSTWIKSVDSILKGAKRDNAGVWTDRQLYYPLAHKLMGTATSWYVLLDERLRDRDRTWSYLKKALLRRYGERLDRAAAERRVNARIRGRGESYADFAAGLRKAAGRNHVSERVLLAQFYNCLHLTVRALVKMSPEPKTLEEAVDKALEIDDRDENVALGLADIGHPWPLDQGPRVMIDSDENAVVPGVGNTGLTSGRAAGDGVEREREVAFFTNPRGVYSERLGLWEAPRGRVWNGQAWVPPVKRLTKKSSEEASKVVPRKPKPKAKALRIRRAIDDSEDDENEPPRKRNGKARRVRRWDDSSEEEEDEDSDPEGSLLPKKQRRPRKKAKAAVRRVTDAKTTVVKEEASTRPAPTAPVASAAPAAAAAPTTPRYDGQRCYACGELGHFADRCPDAEAKARNDAYLERRAERRRGSGNEERA